jgi:hypothetical protein
MFVFQFPLVQWNLRIRFALSANRRCSWGKKLKIALIGTSVVSFSQRSEKLRLHNLVQVLTISEPGLKAASSNAWPGCTVHILGMIIQAFWKKESKPIKWHQMSPPDSPTFFVFMSIVYGSKNASNSNVADSRSTFFEHSLGDPPWASNAVSQQPKRPRNECKSAHRCKT